MRLDKYLAQAAQCTRSEARSLLQKGRVSVNGAVCKKADIQLKEGDAVAVDGAPLRRPTPGGSSSRRGGWIKPAAASCC